MRIQIKVIKNGLAILAILLLASCTLLQSPLEPLQLSVQSIQLLPAEGLQQRFRLGLRVANPNSARLVFEGASFKLSINDYDVLQGVSDDIPPIEGFSEATFKVDVASNLINSLRLISESMEKPEQKFRYSITAKLQLRKPFRRQIEVSNQGVIN